MNILTLVIALLSFGVSVWTLWRTKSNDKFALRQSVLLKVESARSAWYKLRHEADSLVHAATISLPSGSPEAEMVMSFLNDHREHLDLCIRDAVALAEDVQANVETFDEKKCREYLRHIEPSIEKLVRNQGVLKLKVNELIERWKARSET